jgi:uncharacterized membrane protein
MSTATTSPDGDLVTRAQHADPPSGPPERPGGLLNSRGFLYAEMLVGALISLVAAFALSVDAVALAADPGVALACDVNSVISCGAVGTAWQSSVFGFPNAFLGLIAEPVVITVAVAGLGGVRFPRWFMISAQTVYLLGLVFAYWLFAQSIFVIGALCPWCLTVTLSTTLVFVSMLHLNILDDNLRWPRRVQSFATSFARSGALAILTLAWLLFLVAAILLRYGAALFG